ncbi:MAG: hypothetical protein FWF84_00745 [Kiritimatiellaeota bacterium]|nr:hypothetical protein [Kiritimatiellota bacterium]
MKNLFLAFVFCVGGYASAETLGEAAARFEALGMPSVAGAEYANITRGQYGYGIDGLGGSGNAWKVAEETADGKRVRFSRADMIMKIAIWTGFLISRAETAKKSSVCTARPAQAEEPR